MQSKFQLAAGDLSGEPSWENKSEVALEIHLGRKLWLELQPGSPWWRRLAGVQQQLYSSYGVPLPAVELRLEAELEPSAYRFCLAGANWEGGWLYPGRWFATGSPEQVEMLLGEMAQEPIYGLEGRWIPESRAEGAQELGCQLISAEALWVGHLCDRLESRLECCLDLNWLALRCRAQGLKAPSSGFYHLLRLLLEERVSIRDLSQIEQAYRVNSGNPRARLVGVRRLLSHSILHPWLQEDDQLPCLQLTSGTSRQLARELARPEGPEEWFLQRFLRQLLGELHWAQERFGATLLVVPTSLRRALFELLPFELRYLPVMAAEEIPSEVTCHCVAEVGSRVHPLVSSWPSRTWESQPALRSLLRLPYVN